MTEIEQIKEDLIEWERDGMCAIDPDVIRSLITTIESQAFKIETYNYNYQKLLKETQQKDALLESQKEEIERLRNALQIFADRKNWTDGEGMFGKYHKWVPYPMEEAPYLFIQKVLFPTSKTEEGDK